MAGTTTTGQASKTLAFPQQRRHRRPYEGGGLQQSRGQVESCLRVPIVDANLVVLAMLTPEERLELNQAIERAQELYATALGRMSVSVGARHQPAPEPAPAPVPELPTSEVESANHLKAADPEKAGAEENHETTTDVNDKDHDHETGSRENSGATDGANATTDTDEKREETSEQDHASDGEGNGPDSGPQVPVTTDDQGGETGESDEPSDAVQAAMLAAMMAAPAPTETTGAGDGTTTSNNDHTEKAHGNNQTQRKRAPRGRRG